jgi:ATPase subunit of ABC transporter with duplicated ATPase domains
MKFLYVHNLTFTYEQCTEPLFDSVSFQLQRGWTGIVGANGSGKTTLLQLLSGILEPDSGSISYPGSAYYCAQRTDDMPVELPVLIQSFDSAAYILRHTLHIEDGWIDYWDKLSHGERRRCQLACALFAGPELLAVDEPSNHLDHRSKIILFDALRSFDGFGVLVSHDRELLDNLCHHTLFIDPPDIDLRKCNYSVAAAEIKREQEHAAHEYVHAKKEEKKLKRKVHLQHQKVQQSDARKSKKHVSRKDHDAKEKIDRARLSGKDSIAARKKRQLTTRLQKAQEHKHGIQYKKRTTLGITVHPEKKSHMFPVSIEPHSISLGDEKILQVPSLRIRENDRIGITGDNGSGKSTFIHDFIQREQLPDDQCIYIPQEISAEESRAVIQRVDACTDSRKGRIMNTISRLGSDPVRVLETAIPTPGEVRKLMLAEGLMKQPGIIIMDEPTNHMDLPSMQCLEDALNECTCTLILVSHDFIFLKSIVSYFWSFTAAGDKGFEIVMQYEP